MQREARELEQWALKAPAPAVESEPEQA
jgi:hypothetical protein